MLVAALTCWSPPSAWRGRAARTRPCVAQQEGDDLESKLNILYAAPAGSSPYLEERDSLVGSLDSTVLLDRDEAAALWPLELDPAPDSESMVWVDELSCIGCQYCTSIARSTFKMADEVTDFGTARVVQQGGDQVDVVDEAIDSCPADCIHKCTRAELRELEEYRALFFSDMMARWSTRRLVASGEGGGAVAAPHWRDPLVHTDWKKGERYSKTARLKLVDPLLP